MVFSSIAFLFYFLPLFLLAYFALPFRNAVFLVFSLIFYTLGEGPHLFLLLACVAYNHRFAILIENESARRGPGSKRWISIAIAVNLGVLGLFKYGGFLMAQLAPVLHLFGAHPLQHWPLALPFGISFFTFHALSYLIDVYRRDVKAERNLLALALYITMFPQLIAGPIVRFKTIVGELHGRRETMEDIAEGIRIFVIGLAQKTLIANTLALPADRIFALPTDMVTAPVAWIGAIAYGLQLYFDFSGYSLMAIGLARALGLHFPRNFDYPYISKSITEFWRRWHITLSQWFRDYVYIPLGGNREGALTTYRNLIIVFFLCGLWHGAAWTFVIWGLWHGLFLVIERMGLGRVLARLPSPIAHAYALLVVVIGWVMFRSPDFPHAMTYLKIMAGLGHPGETTFGAAWFLSTDVVLAFIAAFIGSLPTLPWLTSRLSRWSETAALPRLFVAGAGVVLPLGLLMLCTMLLALGTYNPFLYFRF
ncbi:MAG TPA: MBOAT family protein [Verrucomicrobiae bacterium]|jgi:alginate O-acetyltransferase complex protein AlgI|nr:MBOAT family protein [Verrucomicrobiae bacterium]